MAEELKRENGKKIEWINCAKAVAILAVLLGHTGGLLYYDYSIVIISCFNVSLFVLISGYLSYGSIRRHNSSYLQTIIRSCKTIFLAYLLATFVYVVAAHRFFDVMVYLDALIHFNASGPLYYVLLYIQLMVASKAIYDILFYNSKYTKHKEKALDFVLGVIICFIAYITTNYSNVLGVFGGGGKLLGGTFLILLYIGMILNKYKIFTDKNKITVVVMLVISLLGCLALCWLIRIGCQPMIDSKVPFGEGINPPSITLMSLSLCVLFLCYSLFTICSWVSWSNYVIKPIAWVGKHTLYIFLYHHLWMDYFLNKYLLLNNIRIKQFMWYLIMIAASVMVEYLIKYIKRFVKKMNNSIDE